MGLNLIKKILIISLDFVEVSGGILPGSGLADIDGFPNIVFGQFF